MISPNLFHYPKGLRGIPPGLATSLGVRGPVLRPGASPGTGVAGAEAAGRAAEPRETRAAGLASALEDLPPGPWPWPGTSCGFCHDKPWGNHGTSMVKV